MSLFLWWGFKHQMPFRKLKRRLVYIFAYSIFSSFLIFQGSFFIVSFMYKEYPLPILFKNYLCVCLFVYFRERVWKGKKRVRETLIGCLLHSPNWGPGSKPRQVLWLGIKLATLQGLQDDAQPTESHQSGLPILLK